MYQTDRTNVAGYQLSVNYGQKTIVGGGLVSPELDYSGTINASIFTLEGDDADDLTDEYPGFSFEAETEDEDGELARAEMKFIMDTQDARKLALDLLQYCAQADGWNKE